MSLGRDVKVDWREVAEAASTTENVQMHYLIISFGECLILRLLIGLPWEELGNNQQKIFKHLMENLLYLVLNYLQLLLYYLFMHHVLT